jgi:hypothetical protein
MAAGRPRDGRGHNVALDAFISTNREELIKRTRAKVASRSSPQTTAVELEQGVPLFLSQLSATLKEVGEVKDGQDEAPTPLPAETPTISQSAAAHGLSLLEFGFTIEQVVHDYGDACQAITELAQERGATLSIVEFSDAEPVFGQCDCGRGHVVEPGTRAQRESRGERREGV